MKLKQRETGRQGVAQMIFRKRSRAIYAGVVRRAAKIYGKTFEELPNAKERFDQWLLAQFGGDPAGTARCAYSGAILTAETFFVDHRTPLSRGGNGYLENLAICSEKENLRKGIMNAQEYANFRNYVGTFMPEVQQSIWRRLEVGDVQRFSYFRRQRKK